MSDGLLTPSSQSGDPLLLLRTDRSLSRRFVHAHEVIEKRHSNPALTLAEVAGEVSVSSRLLQLILPERGTSFTEELLKACMVHAIRLGSR